MSNEVRKKRSPWSFLTLLFVTMLFMVALLTSGCGAYKEELHVTVKPHQTAFVIDLEGATSQQAQLKSLEALKKKQVSQKNNNYPLLQCPQIDALLNTGHFFINKNGPSHVGRTKQN